MRLLIDFGKFFYLPEMKWSEEKQFRAAEMPSRWAHRLTLLGQAIDMPSIFFSETLNTPKVTDEMKSRVEIDIKIFCDTYYNHVSLYAQKWLSFPFICFGLGDRKTENAKEIAFAIIMAKKNKKFDKTSLTKYIKINSKTNHDLFSNPELFKSLTSFLKYVRYFNRLDISNRSISN